MLSFILLRPLPQIWFISLCLFYELCMIYSVIFYSLNNIKNIIIIVKINNQINFLHFNICVYLLCTHYYKSSIYITVIMQMYILIFFSPVCTFEIRPSTNYPLLLFSSILALYIFATPNTFSNRILFILFIYFVLTLVACKDCNPA